MSQITGLLPTLARADSLKSVDALKQAVNDGTIPGYIGVPMIADLIKKQQQAQGMAQPQPTATVEDQVYAQAAQLQNPQPQMPPQPMPQQQMPPQQVPQPVPQQPMPQPTQLAGITGAQSNLPTRAMAGGGIVAFAGGGLGDEDYNSEEDEDNEEYYADIASKNQRAKMIASQASDTAYTEALMQQAAEKQGGYGYGVNPEQQGEVNKGITYKEPLPSGGSKGITANVDRDQARKYNVGNLRPSGFTYPGQVGISGGGFAMFENPEAGVAALNQDIGIKLRRGLDTPLKFISVYAPAAYRNDVGAYAGNVARALGIGPNDRIPDTPEARSILASAITRQEGAHKATARFNNGGVVAFGDPILNPNENQVVSDEPESALGAYFKGTPEEQAFGKKYLEDARKKAKIEKALTAPELDLPFYKAVRPSERAAIEAKRNALYKQLPGIQPAPSEPINQLNINPAYVPDEASGPYIDGQTAIPKAVVPPAIIPTPQISAEEAIYNDIVKANQMREARNKSDRTMDNYLALIQAGLGMMGGTSPYAFANIGQGGSAGISYLANARKQQGLNERGLARNQMDLLTARQSMNTAKENRLSREKIAGETAQINKQKVIETVETQRAKAVEAKLKSHGINEMIIDELERKKFEGKLDEAGLKKLEGYKTLRNRAIAEAKSQYTIPTFDNIGGAGWSASVVKPPGT